MYPTYTSNYINKSTYIYICAYAFTTDCLPLSYARLHNTSVVWCILIQEAGRHGNLRMTNSTKPSSMGLDDVAVVLSTCLGAFRRF